MKKLDIKNGELYLGGERIENLKSFNIASSSNNKNIAELTIRMDVLIDSEVQTESMK